MQLKEHLKHSIPSEILMHIGDMTVSFAILEYSMQMLFITLLDKQEHIGQILATYLPFSKLRAALVSLYKQRYREDTDYSTLKKLMVRAGKLEEERNLITHSLWVTEKTGRILRIKITAREKRGYETYYKEYDARMLADFAGDIRDLAMEIESFNWDVVYPKTEAGSHNI